MALKGIDVSVHQGKIDWAKVKKAGIDFAIIRAGYGKEVKQKDKQFENNYAGAKNAGIPIGAYWYSYATSVERAKQEAETCLKVLNGRKLDLPVFFDQEYEKSILALSNQARTNIVLAFTEVIRKAGYKPGLYSSLDFYKNKLISSQLTALPLWIAAYTSKKTFNYSNLWAWQYSSKGKVSGISGNVDMNEGYFSIAANPQKMTSSLLRKGDTGDKVKLLQHRLNLCGAVLQEDGIWGVQTDAAVRSYQYKAGLAVDGIVGPKTQASLIPDSILASGKAIADYMVKHKWHYKDGIYKAKSTFQETKKQCKPGCSCAHYVSWVLQDAGLLKSGKLISHSKGSISGVESLIDCQIIKAGKKWDKLSDLRAGDICVWNSNLAIYAGKGKWYDAGGPFQANCRNNVYYKVCGIAPYYDRNTAIAYLVRAKI